MVNSRTTVLWLGEKADIQTESKFSDLDINLRYLDNDIRELTNQEFSHASALIINTSDGIKFGLFLTRLSLIIQALDHGLIVIVECSLENIITFEHYLNEKGLNKERVIAVINDSNKYKNFIQLISCSLRQSGSVYNHECKILPDAILLKDYQKTFLKRAFSDCTEIHLKPLTPGFSASGVFCVHATLAQGERPMPFFAKFDSQAKIIKEYENYMSFVLPTIPFNLRPNIDYQRCIFGGKKGLLVGNFVENSEPLWNFIITGNAKTPINSLFENTLNAWRHPLNTQTSNSNLIDKIEEPSGNQLDILKSRFEAAKRFGKDVLPPNELIDLLNNLPLIEFTKTRIHGDLHSENVQVRNGEAILIDYTKAKWGAPSMDPSYLEVWIAFFKWPNLKFEKWKKIINLIYELEKGQITLPKIKHYPEDNAENVAIWNCIRQIRALAFPLQADKSNREYQGCLAYSMYFFSKFQSKSEIKAKNKLEEQRRNYAYFLANKLASSIAISANHD